MIETLYDIWTGFKFLCLVVLALMTVFAIIYLDVALYHAVPVFTTILNCTISTLMACWFFGWLVND